MTTVQQQSISDGTLSPDLRVNYESGLVLGVNEFRQEQDYFLKKEYLYNQELQGCGTISGLRVTAESLPGKEVQITVGPGMGLDQLGRPVIVRSDQCARLTAWLAKQEKDNPGELAKHRDADAMMQVYITVNYCDFPDAIVPVAGQGCSPDTTPVPSRIRDSYDIEFSWSPPQMPAWDAIRCFSKVLSRIRIKSGESRNDEEDIIELVRKLDQPDAIDLCAPPSDDDENKDDDSGEQVWYLPADDARDSLDRIFTVWVTEIRPKLIPGTLDINDMSTTGILLARLDFNLDDDFPDTDPKVEHFEPPTNDGRPFLLHTQFMQELLLLGRHESSTSGRDGDSLPEREFATLRVRNNRTLQVWLHYDYQLDLSTDDNNWNDMLEVRCNGVPLVITDVEQLATGEELNNVFEITVEARPVQETPTSTATTTSDTPNTPNTPNTPDTSDTSVESQSTVPLRVPSLLVPGSRIELLFKTDGIMVEDDDDDDDDDNAQQSLGEKAIAHVGREIEEGVEAVGEGVVKGVEEVGEGVVKGVEAVGRGVEAAIGEGVEIVGEGVEVIGEGVEKLGSALKKDFGGGLGDDIKHAGEGVEHAGDLVEKEGQEVVTEAKETKIDDDNDDKDDKDGDGAASDDNGVSLSDSIDKHDVDFVGYDDEQNIITVYTIASHTPSRELVTCFTFDPEADANTPHGVLQSVVSSEHFLALWFHTDAPVLLPEQVQVRRVFINQPSQTLLFKTRQPNKDNPFSLFWALEPQNEQASPALIPGELLTIVLNTNEILVGDEGTAEALTDAMDDMHCTFVGYDGDHTAELSHQVSWPQRADSVLPLPAMPFVSTAITRRSSPTEATFELWFHPSIDPGDDLVFLGQELTFDVALELGSQRRRSRVTVSATTAQQPNVFLTTITLPNAEANSVGYYMRFRFPLDSNPVSTRSGTTYPNLGEYIRASGARFEGYNGSDAIIAYTRIPVMRP